MAVQYLFATADDAHGQYVTPTRTTPVDTAGGGNAVTVIINSTVPRGQVEKALKRAIKYASSDYQPTIGA